MTLFDIFEGMMFCLACWVGQMYGSLFAGAMVGCFVMYVHYWGGWLSYYATRRASSRGVREYAGFVLGLLWMAVCFALSLFLPSFVLSFIKC